MTTIEINPNDMGTTSTSSQLYDQNNQSGNKSKNWFKNLNKKNKILFISGIFILLLLIVGAVIFSLIANNGTSPNTLSKSTSANNSTPTPTPTPAPPVYNPINGLLVPIDQVSNLNRPPVAMMIENSTPARPQSSLNSADVVYEALAEGGITRFMAVFLQNTPSKAGPVRSARTYYLDWASEYSPVYTHWGGNSDALTEIPQIGIHNIDAVVSPGSDTSCPTNASSQQSMFCRDNTREAPHNGYANLDNIWKNATSQGWTGSSSFTSWTFKEDAIDSLKGIDGQVLTVKFMNADTDYDAAWTYNQSTNDYTRANGGTPQIDAVTNDPIKFKTIIVQSVVGNLYTSSAGKVVFKMNNSGTGKASIFQDGKEVDGTWKKSSMTDRTMYYDNQGNLISFNRGRIWITTIQPNLGSFSVK